MYKMKHLQENRKNVKILYWSVGFYFFFNMSLIFLFLLKRYENIAVVKDIFDIKWEKRQQKKKNRSVRMVSYASPSPGKTIIRLFRRKFFEVARTRTRRAHRRNRRRRRTTDRPPYGCNGRAGFPSPTRCPCPTAGRRPVSPRSSAADRTAPHGRPQRCCPPRGYGRARAHNWATVRARAGTCR